MIIKKITLHIQKLYTYASCDLNETILRNKIQILLLTLCKTNNIPISR